MTPIEMNDLFERTIQFMNFANNGTWNNFILMLSEIREHAKNNGRSIIAQDNPKILKLGLKCQITGLQWYFGINLLRPLIMDNDFPLITIVKEINNKDNFAEFLNNKQ